MDPGSLPPPTLRLETHPMLHSVLPLALLIAVASVASLRPVAARAKARKGGSRRSNG
jgi:hypothetical protein